MKLYIMPGACSLASHIALIWAGARYEVIELTHFQVRAEPFLHINPKGAVPVLVLDDGLVLTESHAILQYIAEQYPAANLGANNALERAQLNERLSDLVSDVHPAWSPVFVPDRFVTKESNRDDARNATFLQLDLQYRRLDGLMKARQWQLFDRRTIADAYLYVVCRWKDNTPTPAIHYPALDRFKLRLDADLGVKQALSEEVGV